MKQKRGVSESRRNMARLTEGEANALQAIVRRMGGVKPAAARLGVGPTTLEAGIYGDSMMPSTKARLLDAMAREVTP